METTDENGMPYSPVYLKTIHNQLSAMSNHAVRFYGLPENPAAKAGNMGKEKCGEVLVWTKDEYLQFIETLRDNDNTCLQMYTIFAMLVRVETAPWGPGRKGQSSRKERIKSQLVTQCNQLKMVSPQDGKRYPTDVANTEVLLRIIQFIPSPKAELFKLWLAQVGRERIEKTIDLKLPIASALEIYLKRVISKLRPRCGRSFCKCRQLQKRSDFAILSEKERGWQT